MLSVKMVSKPGLTIAALVLSPPGHVVAIAGLLPPEHPALLIIYSSADEHLPRIRSLKGHILFGRAQAGLVAAHQEIGITIDQHDRVGPQSGDQQLAAAAQWMHADLLECVDGVRQALRVEPSRESAFGEVVLLT